MITHIFEQHLVFNGQSAQNSVKILLQQRRRLLPESPQYMPRIADRLLLMPLGTEEHVVEIVERRFMEGDSLAEAGYNICSDPKYYHVLFDVMNISRGPTSYFVCGRHRQYRQEGRVIGPVDGILMRGVLETFICVGFSVLQLRGPESPVMTMFRELVYDLSREYRAYVAPEYHTLLSRTRPAHV